MTHWYAWISSFFVRDEEGQGLAEYALILLLSHSLPSLP